MQETEEYCRGTLCNEEVAQWVTSMLVCWGGSVRYRSAFEVSPTSSLRRGLPWPRRAVEG